MTYRDIYARKNLFYNIKTKKYYKIDYSAKSLVDFKDNCYSIRFLFRPVKQKWCFLIEDGLGFYDNLRDYIKVKHYGDIK